MFYGTSRRRDTNAGIIKRIAFNSIGNGDKFSRLMRIIYESAKVHNMDIVRSSIYVNDIRTSIAKDLSLDDYHPSVISAVRAKVYSDSTIYQQYKDTPVSVDQVDEESPSLSELEETDSIDDLKCHPSGLINPGCICYFNAAVHLLSCLCPPNSETRIAQEIGDLVTKINSGKEGVLDPTHCFFVFANEFVYGDNIRKYNICEEGNSQTCLYDLLSKCYNNTNEFTIKFASNTGVRELPIKNHVVEAFSTSPQSFQSLITSFINSKISVSETVLYPKYLIFDINREKVVYDGDIPIDIDVSSTLVQLERTIILSSYGKYILQGYIEMTAIISENTNHYIAKRIIDDDVFTLDDSVVQCDHVESSSLYSSKVIMVAYRRE